MEWLLLFLVVLVIQAWYGRTMWRNGYDAACEVASDE